MLRHISSTTICSFLVGRRCHCLLEHTTHETIHGTWHTQSCRHVLSAFPMPDGRYSTPSPPFFEQLDAALSSSLLAVVDSKGLLQMRLRIKLALVRPLSPSCDALPPSPSFALFSAVKVVSVLLSCCPSAFSAVWIVCAYVSRSLHRSLFYIYIYIYTLGFPSQSRAYQISNGSKRPISSKDLDLLHSEDWTKALLRAHGSCTCCIWRELIF